MKQLFKRLLPFLLFGVVFFLMIILRIELSPEQHAMKSIAGFIVLILFCVGLIYFFVKQKRVLLTNIMTLFGLLVLLEFACFFLLGMPQLKTLNKSKQIKDKTHRGYYLGSFPIPNKPIHDVKKKGSKVIFDANYTIDEYSRRVTPLKRSSDSLRNKYALFFGCSICFGYGLNDDETLPFHFQDQTAEFNTYNYGWHGYGTNQMLSRFRYENLREQVPEKEGVGIYVFHWSHIRRAIGGSRVYMGWGSIAPYYTKEGDSLVHKGTFRYGRGLVSRVYEWLAQSYAFKYFEVILPVKLNERHLRLVVEMIKSAQLEYKQQFGNDHYYVLIHPSSLDILYERHGATLIALLEEYKIPYFDLHETVKLDKEHKIIGDGHPNSKTYEKVSRELIKALKVQ